MVTSEGNSFQSWPWIVATSKQNLLMLYLTQRQRNEVLQDTMTWDKVLAKNKFYVESGGMAVRRSAVDALMNIKITFALATPRTLQLLCHGTPPVLQQQARRVDMAYADDLRHDWVRRYRSWAPASMK